MTKLIIGASGAVGIPLIGHLVRRGENLRALSSNETSAERLRSLGVKEVIVGDYRKEGILDPVFEGVEAVCYIPPRFVGDEFEIGKKVVAAARKAQVSQFLFCSAFQPQLQELGHHWQKLQLEALLVESDLMATVVHPTMFMQNLRVEWPQITEHGRYSRPYSPDAPLNVIDTGDLGEAMAKIMTQPELQGATYQLSGDGPISHAEMAKQISDEIGRPVEAIKRDINDWKTWAAGRGWSDYGIETYVKMCDHYDKHGYKYANPFTLTALLGRPPVKFPEFLKAFVQAQN